MTTLAEIESNILPGSVVLWGLGGPSYAIRTHEAILYVDLFTGPSPRKDLVKLTANIIDPVQVCRAEAVLCTHVHIDHCHEGSLKPLYEQTDALFIAAKSCCDAMGKWGFSGARIVELAPGQQLNVKDVSITSVPSLDWSDPYAIGFIFQAQGVTLYESGDCMYFSGFQDIGQRWEIDVALLNYARNPSPEFAPFMKPEEILKAAKEMRASRVLLKHWDLWQHTFASPGPVVELLAAEGIDASAIAQGDKIVFNE